MRKKKSQEPFSLFAFQDAIASVCGLVVLITLILALELTKKIVDEASAPPPSEIDVQKLTNEIATLKANLTSLENTTAKWSETALGASRAQFSLAKAETELRDAQDRLAETLAENERLQALIADAETRERRGELARDVVRLQTERDELEREIARLASQNAATDETSVFYSASTSVRETPWLVDVDERHIVARSLGKAGASDGLAAEFAGRGAKTAFLAWARQRDRNAEYFVLLFRPSGVALHDDLRDSLEKSGYKIGVDLIGETQTIEIAQ